MHHVSPSGWTGPGRYTGLSCSSGFLLRCANAWPACRRCAKCHTSLLWTDIALQPCDTCTQGAEPPRCNAACVLLAQAVAALTSFLFPSSQRFPSKYSEPGPLSVASRPLAVAMADRRFAHTQRRCLDAQGLTDSVTSRTNAPLSEHTGGFISPWVSSCLYSVQHGPWWWCE